MLATWPNAARADDTGYFYSDKSNQAIVITYFNDSDNPYRDNYSYRIEVCDKNYLLSCSPLLRGREVVSARALREVTSSAEFRRNLADFGGVTLLAIATFFKKIPQKALVPALGETGAKWALDGPILGLTAALTIYGGYESWVESKTRETQKILTALWESQIKVDDIDRLKKSLLFLLNRVPETKAKLTPPAGPPVPSAQEFGS